MSRIDLLRLTAGGAAEEVVRYAQSSIGLGLTPVVAVDLEKGQKGSLREMVTVVRAFAKIAQMAKVATLSEDQGRPDDGLFEVITLRHTAKWRILATAIKASTSGLGKQPSVSTYSFTTLKPLPLQIDGEVIDLPAGATVRVDIASKALQTVL